MAKHMCSKTLYISTLPYRTKMWNCQLSHHLGKETLTAISSCFHFELNTTFTRYTEGKMTYCQKHWMHRAVGKNLRGKYITFLATFYHISPLWYLKLLNIEYKGALTTISLFRLYTYPFKLLISQPFQNPPEW